MTEHDPFQGPPPAEVPLKGAPLIRVVAAIHFPSVLSVEQPGFLAPFQEVLRARYPVLREERLAGILIGPQGFGSSGEKRVWRFADLEGQWRVSVAAEYVAIETTAYVSRKDFVDRFAELVVATDEHIGLSSIDRFGLRYIDRVTNMELKKLHKLVRPEFLGIAAVPFSASIAHAVSETIFKLGSSNLMVRWVRLPRNATFDPTAVEPISEESWVLDLDMSATPGKPVAPQELGELANSFAERIYSFFRWAVTDEFLRSYGGTP